MHHRIVYVSTAFCYRGCSQRGACLSTRWAVSLRRLVLPHSHYSSMLVAAPRSLSTSYKPCISISLHITLGTLLDDIDTYWLLLMLVLIMTLRIRHLASCPIHRTFTLCCIPNPQSPRRVIISSFIFFRSHSAKQVAIHMLLVILDH